MHVALTVRDQSDIKNVSELLQRHATLSRGEPGCLRFELFQSQLDPHLFFILEAWESQETLDVHRQAEGFKTIYEPQVLPLVDRAAHPLVSLGG